MTSTQTPPPGYWQASDGNWYPPQQEQTPAPKKKGRKWPWVAAAGVVAIIAISATGGGGNDKSDSASNADKPASTEEASAPAAENIAEPKSDPEVSRGLGSKDASADVTEAQIIRSDDEYLPIDEVSVRVTNNSSKRSDYFVDVAVESPDGSTKIDSTTIMVMNLEPGQSTVEKGMITKEIPADAVAKIKSVQRTASN